MEGVDRHASSHLLLACPNKWRFFRANITSEGAQAGRPYLPFLFVLAMDPLQRIMNLATEAGLLAKLPGRRHIMRCSFYADDVALFMTPDRKSVV